MAAGCALIDVSAESGRTASLDGSQHFQMQPVQPVTDFFDKLSPCGSEPDQPSPRIAASSAPVTAGLVAVVGRFSAIVRPADWPSGSAADWKDAGKLLSLPDRDGRAEAEWFAGRHRPPADESRSSAGEYADERQCPGRHVSAASRQACQTTLVLIGRSARMPAVAGEQPCLWLSSEAAPV